MDLTISTLTLEAYLLVVVRTGCFFAIAPIFGNKAVNGRLRVLIAACVSIIVFTSIDYSLPEYSSVFGYSFLILKEAFVGLSLGFVSNLVMAILVMAGEFIDREIGFTMSSNFDASIGAMVTITAEFYDRLVCLVILITNLHYYILQALIQSFELAPLGKVVPNTPVLYSGIISFIGEYFSIGFRIAMPVFLGATMLSVILGVLAKSSPQMNMFAIGIQLKVFVGLALLTITILFIPNITTYLMEKMQYMLATLLGGL
ncbi:MAG: flagellar biosynthetic protein FliR [Lachnospiraceae bacterium]|nr:flagellar biosynthetic protein FliR [Lachnospiraceae bacterium]